MDLRSKDPCGFRIKTRLSNSISHHFKPISMKNILLIALHLACFTLAFSVSAQGTPDQTKNNKQGRQVAAGSDEPIDLVEKIQNLPEKDGTYLLSEAKGIKVYAVKKGNAVVDYKVTDLRGRALVLENITADPDGGNENTQSRVKRNCTKCVVGPDGARLCFDVMCI
jgi:hypothetical protein